LRSNGKNNPHAKIGWPKIGGYDPIGKNKKLGFLIKFYSTTFLVIMIETRATIGFLQGDLGTANGKVSGSTFGIRF
jgi:hypothetical protein